MRLSCLGFSRRWSELNTDPSARRKPVELSNTFQFPRSSAQI